MQNKTDYLLKYVTNETYQKILKNNHSITIQNLIDNRIDVDLNIRHLISYDIKNLDKVIEARLDDLLLSHQEFIKKINTYEENLGKDGLVNMLENS